MSGMQVELALILSTGAHQMSTVDLIISFFQEQG